MLSTWTHYRAKVASLSRDRRPDDPELIQARHDLRAALLQRQVSDALPQLSDEVRRDLADLLVGGDAR